MAVWRILISVFVLTFAMGWVSVKNSPGVKFTEQEQEMIDFTLGDLEDRLVDPTSGIIKNLHISYASGNPAVCGRFNAKNSYGGYAGWLKFVGIARGGKKLPFAYTRDDLFVSKARRVNPNRYPSGVYDARDYRYHLYNIYYEEVC